MNYLKTILMILLCFSWALNVTSDEIKLLDNTYFKGKVKKATSDGIYFQVEGLDKTIFIEWSKISKENADALKKKLAIKSTTETKTQPAKKSKSADRNKNKFKKSEFTKPIPKDANTKYKISLAKVHVDYNNMAQAKPLLKSAESTAVSPDEKRHLYSTYGYFYKKNKQPDKSSEYYEKRLEIATDHRDKGYTLRELIPELIKNGDFDQAEKHCKTYFSLFPSGYDFSRAVGYIVRIHIKKGDLKEYLLNIESLLKRDPNHFKHLNIALKIYRLRDNPQRKKAIKVLEKLVSIREKNNWYKRLLSDLYYRVQNFEKAITLTEELFKLQDRDRDHYVRRLVDLYRKIEQPEAVMKWLGKIENSSSGNIIYKANILKRMKKKEEARELIQNGINNSGEYKDKVALKFQLAGMDRSDKEYNNALGHYKEIIKNKGSTKESKILAKKRMFDTLSQAGMLDKVNISIKEE